MKLSFIFIALFSLLAGCKQATETSPDVFVIFDIQSDFQNDSVKLIVDNKTFLDSNISTNNLISLAWTSGLHKLTKDNHLMKFSMPILNSQKEFNIDTSNDTSTVIIRYHRSTNEIEISQVKGVVLYE